MAETLKQGGLQLLRLPHPQNHQIQGIMLIPIQEQLRKLKIPAADHKIPEMITAYEMTTAAEILKENESDEKIIFKFI